MEKLIVKAVVILGLTFSYHALSVTTIACAGGPPCNYGTYNSGSGNASSGNMGAHQPGDWIAGSGMGGGPSPADLAAKEKAEQDQKKKYCKDNGYPANVPFCAAFRAEERLKEVRECKIASVTRAENCSSSATRLHEMNSALCSGAKWLGGALGVASGWAAVEGEGAATVLLGGTGMAVYQMGDDCQTDMDRVKDASVASCTIDQTRRDLDCDAIK